jgi:tetratricopeptide (TPR) repeat protein
MNKNKNLSIKETFALAVQNHQKKSLQIAENLYNEILKVEPNHSNTHNNLGLIFKSQKEYHKAKSYFEKAIKIEPSNISALNNLGNILKDLEKHQDAIDYFEKAIKIDPINSITLSNLGMSYYSLGDQQKAKDCFEKAIKIDPNNSITLSNLGMSYYSLGDQQKAKDCFEKAIKIDPKNVSLYSNLGITFNSLDDQQKARDCFEKAIKINPNDVEAYWNLHSVVSNIDEAIKILKKLYEINNNYIRAKIMISALEGCKGNFDKFNDLMKTPEADHPYARSTKWVFSLPELPKIFFSRWNFYDAVIALSDTSRPFYEFGVWRGNSFKHLIKTYKTGFGFDTFTGLPEDWYDEKRGTYPSFGSVPKIKGGEFIVGKFEDTLPKFFSKKRPTASLINFDADLYSSTLCALNNSKKVIDDKTVLIFDEFIMTKNWEQDEFKALNEFCDNSNISFEVIAISFNSGQVAVKLK